VTIIAPTGFTPLPAAVRASGGAAEGMYVSVAGLPTAKLPPVGQSFVKAFGKSIGAVPDPAAVYAAQAADVLLQAIASSSGTRSGVASQLLKVRLAKGLVGEISFDANGDLPQSPVTIYKVVNRASTVFRVIVPSASLLPSA
jgi:ABC-type branched-subunit amino acid transport system substrate-binding protein